jgi:hypothetical protein
MYVVSELNEDWHCCNTNDLAEGGTVTGLVCMQINRRKFS